MSQNIIGTWEITESTQFANMKMPSGFWISFYKDGTFDCGIDARQKLQSGVWKVDSKNSVLILKSKLSNDKSTWFVNLVGMKMQWLWASSNDDFEIRLQKQDELPVYNQINLKQI